MLYKHSSQTNKGKFFSFTQFPEIWSSRFWREKLTSSSVIIGGFVVGQPRSPLILCFPFSGHPNHSSPKHSAYWFSEHYQLASSMGKRFCFCNWSFFNEKAVWFGQDQGRLAQATRRVGMLLAIPIEIANQRLSHNRLPFNTYNPWQS